MFTAETLAASGVNGMVLGAEPGGWQEQNIILLAIDGGGRAGRRLREVCFSFWIVAVLSFFYMGMS